MNTQTVGSQSVAAFSADFRSDFPAAAAESANSNLLAFSDGVDQPSGGDDVFGLPVKDPTPDPKSNGTGVNEADPITLTGVLVGLGIGVIASLIANEISRALHPDDRKPEAKPEPKPNPQAGIIITPLPAKS